METSPQTNRYSLTDGPILAKLLQVSLPVIGSQIVQMTYNLTDMFWLGRVGSDAVAASATAGAFMWLFTTLMVYGRSGAEIGVSQNMGANRPDAARRYAQASVLLNLCLGVLFGVVLFAFCEPFIRFFHIQEEHVARGAKNYLAIVSAGVPAVYFAAAATGMYNGSGNARLPFYINVIGLALNMALDPLLIFTFGMGVEGAAVATVIAQTAAGAALLWALLRYKNRPFPAFRLFEKPESACLKQIGKWGTPIAIEAFLFSLLSTLVTRLVTSFGTGAIAAQRIGTQVESLSWLIASGFSTAITTFVGQNYGAGKWTRIHKGFHISSLAMGVWGLFVTAFVYFGAEAIFTFFLPNEPDVLELGIVYLHILAIAQVTCCLECVAMGAFRGLGRTVPPSVVTIVSSVARVAAAYALTGTRMGLYGAWWAVSVGAVVRGVWMYAWYFFAARRMPKEDAPSLAQDAPNPAQDSPSLAQKAETYF